MFSRLSTKTSTVLLLVLIMFSGMLLTATGCKVETTFGDVIICESVNQKTFEPINPKNEFEMTVKEVSATINLTNVKGSDSYMFLWKNAKTDEVIYQTSGKYQEGEQGYLTGWFSTTISVKEGSQYLAIPGDFKAEFYHNGELKSSADFKIKEPEAKILQVVLTNEINELFEPLTPMQIFNGTEKIYACIQADFLVAGNKFAAKWYSEDGTMILETPFEITQSFYEASWISFNLESAEEAPLPAGAYKVEIFYNDIKFNEYIFTIEAPPQAEIDTLFDQQNMFTEAKDTYGFVIGYPDDFNYEMAPDVDSLVVSFSPQDEEVVYYLMLTVLLKNFENYPTTDSELKSAMDNANLSIGSSDWTRGEAKISDKILADGTNYKEYIYYNEDAEKSGMELILSAIYKLDRLYIFMGVAHESYYEEFNSAYYGSLSKLSFTK